MAFPRADFGDTAPVPAYGAGDSQSPWPAPAPVARPVEEPGWLSAPAAAQAPAPPLGGLSRRQATPADSDAESRRTPSGLVKRTPRVVDTGEIHAIGPSPDDDLLTSLSRYTRQGPATGSNPAVGSPAPTALSPQPSRGPAHPPAPSHAPGPNGPRLPARESSPFSSPAPAPAPRPAPGGGLAGGLGGGLAAGLGGLSPFQGPAASSGARSERAPQRQPAPGDHEAATTGGLTRRVRGAQLPSTNPLAVRRSGAEAGQAPAPAGQGAPAPRAPEPEPKQAADAVYSFLSNFSAGVQRGLDDSRSGRPPQP